MTCLKFNLHQVEPKFVKIKLNFIGLTQYDYIASIKWILFYIIV